MPTLSEVCRLVRSKNAGPFWITVDIAFRDRASFERYASSARLMPHAIGSLYGVDPALVQRFTIVGLLVLKISYPRAKPQGGVVERDMHGGQQYVRLLDVDL